MDDIYVFCLVCLLFFSYGILRIEQRFHERSYLHASTSLMTECVRVLPEIIKVERQSRTDNIRAPDNPHPGRQNIEADNNRR